MAMKATASPILDALGFRRVLVVNCVVGAGFIAINGLLSPATPMALILGILLVGGYFRSLQFTGINAIAYADLDQVRIGRAVSFASVAQQLALSIGVALGAGVVQVMRSRHGGELELADFHWAFPGRRAGVRQLAVRLHPTARRCRRLPVEPPESQRPGTRRGGRAAGFGTELTKFRASGSAVPRGPGSIGQVDAQGGTVCHCVRADHDVIVTRPRCAKRGWLCRSGQAGRGSDGHTDVPLSARRELCPLPADETTRKGGSVEVDLPACRCPLAGRCWRRRRRLSATCRLQRPAGSTWRTACR